MARWAREPARQLVKVPGRIGGKIVIKVAFGTSIPTSMTLVAASTPSPDRGVHRRVFHRRHAGRSRDPVGTPELAVGGDSCAPRLASQFGSSTSGTTTSAAPRQGANCLAAESFLRGRVRIRADDPTGFP
jgi:hypothetical protein